MIIEASTFPGGETAAAPARVRASRRWLLSTACIFYMIGLITVWLTMRQFGDRSWMATVLLMGPRWPYALPLLALWPWAVIARRVWPVMLTSAATYVVAVPILGIRLSFLAGAERGDLRLLTCNVHRRHVDPERLAAYIAEVCPDVVALQDWSDANFAGVFGGGGWETRREGELLVASRLPIQKVTLLNLSDGTIASAAERGAAGAFEIKAPGGTITIICLHLASPHAGLGVFSEDGGGRLSGNVDRRRHESDIVRSACDSVRGPLLLAGDFNTTDDSPIFRECWDEFTDAFSQRGNGLGYTYLNRHTQLRIDHVLARPTTRFLRCWVGPDVGSPHRPLVVDVECR